MATLRDSISFASKRCPMCAIDAEPYYAILPYWEIRNADQVEKGLNFRLREHLHSNKQHRLADKDAESAAARVRVVYSDRKWTEIEEPWLESQAKRRKFVKEDKQTFESVMAAIPSLNKEELGAVIQAATAELTK